MTTAIGHTVMGYLPEWAESDPSRSGLTPDELCIALADLNHHAAIPGQMMPVTSDDGPPGETEILFGGIDCNPYDPGPSRNPVVNLNIIDDYYIIDLDPAGVADIAAKLRAQADRLEHQVRPALIAARADWAAHHPTP